MQFKQRLNCYSYFVFCSQSSKCRTIEAKKELGHERELADKVMLEGNM